jgi:hypothetical protein
LRATAALPVGVRGPVLRAALARLVARIFSLAQVLAMRPPGSACHVGHCLRMRADGNADSPGSPALPSYVMQAGVRRN